MKKLSFTTSCGEEIPVIVDVRRVGRNITLRPKIMPRREIHISKPWLAPTGSALNFLKQKSAWLDKIFTCAPAKIRVKDGDVLEFLGRRVRIRHNPNEKSNFFTPLLRVGAELASQVPVGGEKETLELIIGGDAEMLERRVRDFIKKEFEMEIKKIIKAVSPEFWPKKISLKDTTSRWGSCSASGTMSFSWRLAFAPREVMRYVIMHELAHKKHMNHSPAFWSCVSALYGPGVERAKRWLAARGQELHRYF